MAETFENQAFQGDMMLNRIKDLPATAELVKPNASGKYVVTHSETGHHHTIDAAPNVEFYEDKKDALSAYLRIVGEPATLTHQRAFDTHKPIDIPVGVFHVRRQREESPQGWRRAID